MHPLIGSEDVFERIYKAKFQATVVPYGEFIDYGNDRAAIDIGLHLTESVEAKQQKVLHTRIWFQLKGTHSEYELEKVRDIPIQVSLQHLKFWFASPEPVYLVLYVEAADKFLVEDVRELVYRQWGENFLAPVTFPSEQQSVTVGIRTDAILNHQLLIQMRRHQSMRIDGPFFRGRPLGHRLDPLRCILNKLEPSVYVQIVQRLLSEHDYRVNNDLNGALLFSQEILANEHISITLGKLYEPFQWVPQFFTEFGFSEKDDFRTQPRPEFAHGPIAVCIHGDPRSPPRVELIPPFVQTIVGLGIRQFLVFANTDELTYFGSFFRPFRETGVDCMPQLLNDLAYNLLTVTSVYMEFRHHISWRITNYLLP
jgi:hypothetical protein